MKALEVKEDGLIYAVEVPEEPTAPIRHMAIETQEEYDRALAAAKDSAILVSDQEKAAGMIVLCMKFENPMKYRGSYAVGIKPGIYPIPDLQWRVQFNCQNVNGTCHKHCEVIPGTHGAFDCKFKGKEQVAILKESTPSTEQESQEELLQEIFDMCMGREDWTYQQILNKFTITRRKP